MNSDDKEPGAERDAKLKSDAGLDLGWAILIQKLEICYSAQRASTRSSKRSRLGDHEYRHKYIGYTMSWEAFSAGDAV